MPLSPSSAKFAALLKAAGCSPKPRPRTFGGIARSCWSLIPCADGWQLNIFVEAGRQYLADQVLVGAEGSIEREGIL